MPATSGSVVPSTSASFVLFADEARLTSTHRFRKSLGLKPLTTFLEFNRNPSIARAFEQLYGHPDNIEVCSLLTSLACSDGLAALCRPHLRRDEADDGALPSSLLVRRALRLAQVGAGLCPGYTMSRAILSDAVALVRGDRFFTTCFDAGSLTSFGFLDCVTDGKNGAYGGVLPKVRSCLSYCDPRRIREQLFSRALPNSFRFNSLALMFPFQVPPLRPCLFAELQIDPCTDARGDAGQPRSPRHHR